MKNYFLLFFLLAYSFGFSQKNKEDTLNPLKLKVKNYALSAEKIAPSGIRLPFSAIKIIDSRYDTSKLGFRYYPHFFGTGFRIVKLDSGTAKGIENYYNDYYQNSFQNNGFSLLVVLKTFWLSIKHGDKTNELDISSLSSVEYNSMRCKWEYYLVKDSQYMPIKRVDTLWEFSEELKKLVKEQKEERYLADFKFMLNTLIEQNDFENAVSGFSAKSKKTFEQISTYNESRFKITVIKDSFFKKGVYLNFGEFKNNSPSISEFKEKKMRYSVGTRKEYYLEDLQGKAINSYWGYFDGKDFKYGRYGNDKIYRVGNTFEFLTKLLTANYNDNSVSQRKGLTSILPYQIDMETGEVY